MSEMSNTTPSVAMMSLWTSLPATRKLARKSLKNMHILADLSENQQEELLAQCTPRTFLRNNRIVAKGEVSESMYIVVEGRASAQSATGTESRIIQTGQVFGEIAMINGDTCHETIVAASAKCVCFELTHDMAVAHLPANTLETLKVRADAALQTGESKEQMIPSPITRATEARSASPFEATPTRKAKHRHLKSATEMLREHAMHSTYKAIDTDGSGSVDPQEMRAFFTRIFPKHHPNHKFHTDQINVREGGGLEIVGLFIVVIRL